MGQHPCKFITTLSRYVHQLSGRVDMKWGPSASRQKVPRLGSYVWAFNKWPTTEGPHGQRQTCTPFSIEMWGAVLGGLYLQSPGRIHSFAIGHMKKAPEQPSSPSVRVQAKKLVNNHQCAAKRRNSSDSILSPTEGPLMIPPTIFENHPRRKARLLLPI